MAWQFVAVLNATLYQISTLTFSGFKFLIVISKAGYYYDTLLSCVCVKPLHKQIKPFRENNKKFEPEKPRRYPLYLQQKRQQIIPIVSVATSSSFLSFGKPKRRKFKAKFKVWPTKWFKNVVSVIVFVNNGCAYHWGKMF